MKKNYSAPAITVYGVETANMLMMSGTNSVERFDGNSSNSLKVTEGVDVGTDGNGYDADDAW